ncbi:MAG: hypothetical protein BIFFINMI_01006 [Phycisphaerae bacterium]|nr:hypothetical protein [Phycisphaerae bacterium]
MDCRIERFLEDVGERARAAGSCAAVELADDPPRLILTPAGGEPGDARVRYVVQPAGGEAAGTRWRVGLVTPDRDADEAIGQAILDSRDTPAEFLARGLLAAGVDREYAVEHSRDPAGGGFCWLTEVQVDRLGSDARREAVADLLRGYRLSLGAALDRAAGGR